jgi:hypothetical protein
MFYPAHVLADFDPAPAMPVARPYGFKREAEKLYFA